MADHETETPKIKQRFPVDLDGEMPDRNTPDRYPLGYTSHVTEPPRVQYAHGPKFDSMIAAVENELEQYRPPEKMPEYVEPREGVPPVGALSAEAIVKDFEKTAKGIEAMAAELSGATTRCAEELVALTNKYQALSDQINEVVKHIMDTAASYRDEAKTVFVRIEDTTMKMQEVRKLSEDMRGQLTGISDNGPAADLNLEK